MTVIMPLHGTGKPASDLGMGPFASGLCGRPLRRTRASSLHGLPTDHDHVGGLRPIHEYQIDQPSFQLARFSVPCKGRSAKGEVEMT